MYNNDVVIFAGALFDSNLWTNRQQVAVRLAERGHRVLYVEPRQFLLTRLLGKFPGKGSAIKWLKRSRKPWQAQKNLWVVSQYNLIPRSREVDLISKINHKINARRIVSILKKIGFMNPAILIYDTEAAQYLNLFSASRIVYDCVDDHRTQAGVNRNPKRVEEEEIAIAKRADGVSVTTEYLLKRFEKINSNTRLVPNAADIARFRDCQGREPEDIKNIRHPRIGTVGALDVYKIDFQMLFEVAKKHNEWSFVLVGPVENIGRVNNGQLYEDLSRLKNVFFLGQKKMEEVPFYVRAFDVAMIPYVKSSYNDSSFPLKFWEFMASGKPVVATNLPALRQYKEFFSFGDSISDFESGIKMALTDNKELSQKRVAESEKHDWGKRVSLLEELLAQ